MQTRADRVARGWLLGVAATLAAAVSHALGGGHVPSALAIVLGTVFAGLVGMVAVGRRTGLVRVVAGVAVGQLAFHLLFSVLGTDATITGGGHHSVGTITVTGAHVHGDGPEMWIAHTLASLVTIALVAAADRSVAASLRVLLEPFVRRVLASAELRVVPVPAALTPRHDARPRRGARTARLADSVVRRGPPVLALAR
ncbi:MAG: hypothetical protein J0G30_10890 [Actinomycetales bacterium]|nr:hypothetical protein [Actinomycetales bacterium]